jgi:5-methylcytosine-specific restriction protein A
VLKPKRITGRKLQSRRLRLWGQDPRCKGCGKLTRWPDGFELDHIDPLHKGGPDTDDNCQVLCVPDCHQAKTAKDLGHGERVTFDTKGRVVW